MTRTAAVAAALLLLLPLAPAGAQDGRGTITRWYLFTVKAGHDLQWEQAYQEHLAWHRQQQDTWTWNTYVLVSGDRLGQYLAMTMDHAWADFDAPAVSEQERAADRAAKLGPHIESVHGGVWNEISRFSRPPDTPLPFPLIQIIDYSVKPGKRAVFERNVEQFGQALDETNFPAAYLWFVKPHGGAAARIFTRIVPRENWASMEPGSRSSFEAMRETFGEAGLQAWIAAFGESVEWLTSEFWRHRPDLSYTP